MITTGANRGVSNTGKVTEVINMDNYIDTCNNLEEYPVDTRWAVGGLINDKPLICGGSKGSVSNTDVIKSCYMFDGSSWSFFANMDKARREAAGIALDRETFWITGGVDHKTTSEYIHSDGSVTTGPSLASLGSGFYGHCMVKIGDGRIVLIGKERGILQLLYLFYLSAL